MAPCLLCLMVFAACRSSSDPLPDDPRRSPLVEYEGNGLDSQEKVKLITGDISSIVTLNDYVYACDASASQTIYVKWKFDDTWRKADITPSGKTVTKLAVGVNGVQGKSTLYALADDSTLWVLDIETEEWKEVSRTSALSANGNNVVSLSDIKTIFDLGYFHQEKKDSARAYVLDVKGNYFDLFGTDCPRGARMEPWMSSIVTEQGAGWYYAPKNGDEKKVKFYRSSVANQPEIDLGGTVSSLSCSPRNCLYAVSGSGLKRIPLDIYGDPTGNPADISVDQGSGTAKSVFAQELVIDGAGFEVILAGFDNGLWSYNSYDKVWRQNKFVAE